MTVMVITVIAGVFVLLLLMSLLLWLVLLFTYLTARELFSIDKRVRL